MLQIKINSIRNAINYYYLIIIIYNRKILKIKKDRINLHKAKVIWLYKQSEVK